MGSSDFARLMEEKTQLGMENARLKAKLARVEAENANWSEALEEAGLINVGDTPTEGIRAILTLLDNYPEQIKSLKEKLAKKVSLPKITRETLAEWRGPVYLIQSKNFRFTLEDSDWSQDAVEFAILLAGEALEKDDG